MEFRYLGNSGLKISEITYGNWLTHGSQVENDVATQCVRAALDEGVADTAAEDAVVDARGLSDVRPEELSPPPAEHPATTAPSRAPTTASAMRTAPP